ncbi:asparagine synthase-related protein [Paenibacillus filicis]|uniref:asparagine synthase (glutamine-hydrolyzing) n=1 Tax=Paenibacillus filicis TaxID=669464 RepID=A0ABU9DJI7_9BACL
MNTIIACSWNKRGTLDDGKIDGRSADSSGTATVNRMLYGMPLDGAGGVTSGSFGPVSLGDRDDTAGSDEGRPAALSVPVCLDGALYNREQIRELLAGRGVWVPRTAHDRELIWAAYEAFGSSCASLLRGEFAFVLWDVRTSNLVAACDVVGIRSVVYYDAEDFTLIGTDVAQLLADRRVPFELNRDKLVAHLTPALWKLKWDVLPEQTYFRGIRRLPPGHVLEITPERVQLSAYWSPPNKEIRYRSDSDYYMHYSDLLHQAVQERVQGERLIMPISGGIDSGAIASVAVRELGATGPRALYVTGIAFSTAELQSSSDLSYIDACRRRLGLTGEVLLADQLTRYPNDEQGRDPLFISDGPEIRTTALANYLSIASALRHGPLPEASLSGTGGDETIDGNGYVYDSLLLGGKWRDLHTRLKQASGGSSSELLRMFWQKALLPMVQGGSWHRYMASVWGEAAEPAPFLHPAAEDEVAGIQERLLDDHRRKHFRYRNWARQYIYHRNAAPSRYYASRDGRRVSYPFLDRRLLEFCLRIPPEVIYKEQEGHAGGYSATKTLVRRGLIGTMPSVIRARTDKTFAHAFVRASVLKHYDHYRQSLAGSGSELARLGLVEPGLLREYMKAEQEHARNGQPLSKRHPAIDETLRLEIWLREASAGREALLRRVGFVDRPWEGGGTVWRPAVRQLSAWLDRELPRDAIYRLSSSEGQVGLG